MRPQHHRMQRAVRHVFADAVSGRVVDAHKNHGRNRAFADQAVAGLIDLPFHSGERGRGFKQVLPVIQYRTRDNAVRHWPDRRIPEAATPAGIACYEKCGCETRAGANLPSRTARGSRRQGSGVIILSLLDFFHQEKRPSEYNGGPGSYALAPLIFTTIARRLIREISASEIRHKMHQVISS